MAEDQGIHGYLHADQNVVQSAVDSLPDVTGAAVAPVAEKAAETDLGAVLGGLRRLTSAQLADVVREARVLIESRKCEGAPLAG